MRRATTLRALAVLAAAPLLAGTDRCGLYIESTENLQIYDDVARVVMDVHHGSVTGTAYERPSVYVKRHTSGFDPGVGDFGAEVEGDALTLTGHCDIPDECWYDHMLELPLGTGLDLTFLDGYVTLSRIDGPISARIGEGWFRGYELAAPRVDLEYEAGDVTIEFAAAPAAVTITIGSGDVELTLPAGAYACEVSPAPKLAGITCDPAATSTLTIAVESGAVTLRGV